MNSNPFAGIVDYMEGFYEASRASSEDSEAAECRSALEEIRSALDSLAQRLRSGSWPSRTGLRRLLRLLACEMGSIDIRPLCLEAMEHINRMPSQAEIARRLDRAVEIVSGPVPLRSMMKSQVVTVVLSALAWSRVIDILYGIDLLEGTPGRTLPELVSSPDDPEDDDEE